MSARPSARTLVLTERHLRRIPTYDGAEEPPLRFTPLSDDARLALAQRLLDPAGAGPLWISTYGSLIWKPAFDHVEARRATVHGWRRAFCLELLEWRASPVAPGLMLALDRGGACTGMAYRLPDDDRLGAMVRLLEREVGFVEEIPWQRWVTARGGGQTFRALAFFCAPREDPDLLRLPIDLQADRIARAAGPAGSCAEYLLNTVAALEGHGIHDRYLFRLQALVAARIDALHPL